MRHILQQQGKLRGEEVVEKEREEGAAKGGDTQTTHFQSSLLNTVRS